LTILKAAAIVRARTPARDGRVTWGRSPG